LFSMINANKYAISESVIILFFWSADIIVLL
jgi:hypothetical protein